jgi:hypothetical protein
MCAALLAVAASADVAQRRIPNVLVAAIAARSARDARERGRVVPAGACLGGGFRGPPPVVPWRAGLRGGDRSSPPRPPCASGPRGYCRSRSPRRSRRRRGGGIVRGGVAPAERAGDGGVPPAPMVSLRTALRATTPYGAAIAAGGTYALLLGATR